MFYDQEAINDFFYAIRFKPKYAIAFYYRGIAKIKMDLIESACLDFKKAGELGDENAYEMLKKLYIYRKIDYKLKA